MCEKMTQNTDPTLCGPRMTLRYATISITDTYSLPSHIENSEMSPISLRIVGTKGVPTPGIVVSVVPNCRSSS